jgi:hypothetical protein
MTQHSAQLVTANSGGFLRATSTEPTIARNADDERTTHLLTGLTTYPSCTPECSVLPTAVATGWSTDHSQDAFVATALKAARDREVLPIVASNARKHAAEHLSASRFLERTFELYQSLLQKRQ